MENNSKTFKAGDILCAMWRYSMTYPNFYKVISVTEKTVVIRELAKKTVSGNGWQGNEVPITDTFKSNEQEMRKRIKISRNGTPMVDIDPKSSAMGMATIWDEEPKWADYLD